jgi:hypothetical protein
MNKMILKQIFNYKRRQKGVALLMAMIFLIFVTLTVVPLLTFSAVGMKTGTRYNDKAETLYTADSGIEDAKWQIKYDQLSGKFESYDPHEFASTWAYSLPKVSGQPQINNRNVNVLVKNVWVPKDITAPSESTANTIINSTKLIIIGGAYGTSNYNITITYYPGANEVLKINTIGIWLPPGFSYKTGSNNLGFEPTTSAYQGGQAVVWTFSALPFTSLPGVNTTDVPMSAKITFNYSPATVIAASVAAGNTTLHVSSTSGFNPTGTLLVQGEPSVVAYSGTTADTFTGIPASGTGAITMSHSIGQSVVGPTMPNAISWVDTCNVSGLTFTWDDTVRLFHITSIGDSLDTTLTSAVSVGNTTINVTSTSGFPSKGNLTLPFENNTISYTGKTGTTFTGIPASGSGSIKTAHASGEIVAYDATTIETYVTKSELRKVGGALNGDYFATGNSLMKDADSNGTRETRINSSATVGAPSSEGADDGIPSDANIAASYLYWGTWYQNTTGKCSTLLTDDGTKFYSGGGKFDNGGNWSLYPWGSNFRVHNFGGLDSTRELTEHTALDLHTYAVSPYIATLSWEQWVSDADTPSTPLSPDTCSNFNNWNKPSSSSWSVSSNAFRGHYTSSSAYNRDLPLLNGIDLSSYQPNTVTITWDQWESNIASGDGLNFKLSADGGSTWSSPIKAFDYSDLSAGNIGTSAKTFTYSFTTSTYLTSNFKIQFSLVGFGTTNHYCYIDNLSLNVPPPTYSATDKLQFAMSNDNGATWSSLVTACSADKTTDNGYLSTATFQYNIPVTYLTSSFKVKLFVTGFSDPGEYCNVDDIRIIVLTPDIGLTFKINNGSGDKIVYFDSSGNPANSTNPADQIISTRTQALLTYSYSSSAAPTFNGFAYSCFRDITALVTKYAHQPASPATNFNGWATYSAVGDLGDTGQQLSHAGWSLVNIFTGPETLGHQLYLFDNYFGSRQDSSGVHVDWDGDGVAGGTITGFVVPQQIQGEINSAKLTCFVTEGDEQLTGDYLKVNGTTLWDGKDTSGDHSNIWNGKSIALGNNDGVDIDTPGINPNAGPPQYITWSSNILRPGDTSASIDLYTVQDYWFMIYMIISFRSENTTGGSLNYLIHG